VDIRAEFSQRLKRIMHRNGLSVAELKRQVNGYLPQGSPVRNSHFDNWLKGKAIPREPRRTALCLALGVDEHCLIPSGDLRRRSIRRGPVTGHRGLLFAERLTQTMQAQKLRPVDVMRLMEAHLPQGTSVSQQHLQSWRLGKVPTGPRRLALCSALGLSETDLIPPRDFHSHLRPRTPNQATHQGVFAAKLNHIMALQELGPTAVVQRMAEHLPPGLSVSRPAIWNWRTGRAMPALALRASLCHALNVSEKDLFGPAADNHED
jgi:transcriptional regulator with XRE-family HTH domain